jgi:hypothetical protein
MPIIRPWPRISTTPANPASSRCSAAQARAHRGGVGQQAVLFHDAHGLDACAHGQRIAAEGGAVVARAQHLRRPGPQTMAPIGHARAQALGQRHHVGRMPAHWCANHLPVRPMPHCTSSSISSHRARRRAAQLLQVVDARRVDAAFALDGLQEHRTTFGRVRAASSIAPMSFSGTRTKPHQRLEAGLHLGVAGGRQRGDRTAVEGLLVDDDLRALDALVVAVLAGDLDRASLASRPELQKNTLVRPDSSTSLAASAPAGTW